MIDRIISTASANPVLNSLAMRTFPMVKPQLSYTDDIMPIIIPDPATYYHVSTAKSEHVAQCRMPRVVVKHCHTPVTHPIGPHDTAQGLMDFS